MRPSRMAAQSAADYTIQPRSKKSIFFSQDIICDKYITVPDPKISKRRQMSGFNALMSCQKKKRCRSRKKRGTIFLTSELSGLPCRKNITCVANDRSPMLCARLTTDQSGKHTTCMFTALCPINKTSKTFIGGHHHKPLAGIETAITSNIRQLPYLVTGNDQNALQTK